MKSSRKSASRLKSVKAGPGAAQTAHSTPGSIRQKDKHKTYVPSRVFITTDALRDIILAATEVYKKETLGYLIGIKGEDSWTILDAAPYQTAEKTFTGTGVRQQKIDLIAKLAVQFNSNFVLLGDFHSHTQWGDRLRRAMPSEEDLADAQPSDLYVIIAVNELPKKMRQRQWRVLRRSFVLTGALDKFHFDIAAYYCPQFGKLIKVPLKLRSGLAEALEDSGRRKPRRAAFE